MKKRTVLIGCGNAGVLHELDPLRGRPASLIGGLLEYKDDFDLVGAVDLEIQRAKKVKHFFPEAQLFTDYRKVLKALKPDVVIISTWTSTHRVIFNDCLANGVSGIVLEKPVGKSLKEAKDMLSRWKKNKIPVVVNHIRRWEPWYRYLKDVLAEKPLGRLRSVYGKVLLGSVPPKYEKLMYDLEGGGTMFHDGTHLVDLLYFYFKRLKLVGSHVLMGRIIDKTSHALLLGDGRVPIHIEVGGQRKYFEFSIGFEFESGAVKLGNGIMEWYEARQSTMYTGYRDLKKQPFPVDQFKKYTTSGFSGPFHELKKAFLNDQHETQSSLEDGVKAMDLMTKILLGSQ